MNRSFEQIQKIWNDAGLLREQTIRRHAFGIIAGMSTNQLSMYSAAARQIARLTKTPVEQVFVSLRHDAEIACEE